MKCSWFDLLFCRVAETIWLLRTLCNRLLLAIHAGETHMSKICAAFLRCEGGDLWTATQKGELTWFRPVNLNMWLSLVEIWINSILIDRNETCLGADARLQNETKTSTFKSQIYGPFSLAQETSVVTNKRLRGSELITWSGFCQLQLFL